MFAIARSRRSAFSLIELVIVVVIIGIIAAIAIPRMSRGATGANESTLAGNLAVLRKAVDLYGSEHNGEFPTAADLATKLTSKTDADGTVGTGATHIYGPYLRAIPAMNVGPAAGRTSTITQGTTPDGTAGGWMYDKATGQVWANVADSQTDTSGKKFNGY